MDNELEFTDKGIGFESQCEHQHLNAGTFGGQVQNMTAFQISIYSV